MWNPSLAKASINDLNSATRATFPGPCLRIHARENAGSDEGAFAWLTLNYLLGFLGKDGSETMAAIDLGGGSVQEAFALTDAQAKADPDPLYVTKLKGGGVEYSVYVHRYGVYIHRYSVYVHRYGAVCVALY